MKSGDIVTVKRFAYTNKSGGTGLAERLCNLTIIKSWEDYECGERTWALPDTSDSELMAFLNENAKKGTPDYNPDTYETSYSDEDIFVLFVSEFDVLYKESVINDDVLFDLESDSFGEDE